MERSTEGLGGTMPNFWAEKGKKIIDEEYSTLLGIGEVSSILDISETHFRRVFRLAYNKNPEAYLQEVRIAHAKDLLLQEKLQVCEIGRMVGFGCRDSFERIFTKLMGICPSEFRRARLRCCVERAEANEKF